MQKISLFSLIFLIIAAIDSIRNLPATALFGNSLPFFFLLVLFTFLFPVALLSAEFSSRFSEEGGIFHWIRNAFGEEVGLLAIWLQWINTMVWYPTVLSFLAGTAAYLVNPNLAKEPLFLFISTVSLFWLLTWLNFKGLHVSAKINTICCIIGTLFPMLLLSFLGFIWVIRGEPLQLTFSLDGLISGISTPTSWASLIVIVASFLGMELSGVHIKEIDHPQKNFPKAMGISVAILTTTMLFGALSIALVIPSSEIRLVDGTMQSFRHIFSAFHLSPLVPLLAFLIMIGTFGGMINWLISPAKGLLQASEKGFLPHWLAVKNRHGIPVRILVMQAILVTFFSLCLVLMPSINGFYWFLMALSTGLYMLMYVLLFAAALKLRRPSREMSSFQFPKGTRRLSCWLGLGGAFLTIGVGFIPPEGIDVGTPFGYALEIALGNILLIAPVPFLWYYKKKMGRR